ncbi:hypothetical protein DYL59_19665 [Pseudomonas kairouanensis]|uniref:Uncharacterized protein n=1 Tax=Pseudomonas kairouanensis TaxID=2293832 RepID=A0A4Z0ALA3_9PSED|nr:hypothetical protein [Pseudomonas kairouanensis]TFY87197.1 hypothetical protein DYL59_19665 [Pseudomonas kairouanensis]
MKKSEFSTYLTGEIDNAQQRISPKLTKSDRVDTGRVAFLNMLKNVVNGSASPEDLGSIGALNDVLQELGLLPASKTLLTSLDP